MKFIRRYKDFYIVRLNLGEEYPRIFLEFLKRRKIHGGFFFGLGAFIDPEIAFFDLKTKKYRNRKLKGVFEVLSLVGNVAVMGKEMVVHNHVVLGDKNYKVFGGHLNKGEVHGTLEVFLFKTSPLKRIKDIKTGLNLLH